MNKLCARFWGVWGGSLLVVAVITIATLIAVWFLPVQYNQRVGSSALVLAALMMGWSAWQSRSLAYSSREQIEEMRQQRMEMMRPSLSLIPEDYLLSGDFTTLLLQNTGGLAKEVRIDIEMTSSPEKELLFIPAIDKERVVRLPIKVEEIKKSNGTVRVKVELMDCYGRRLTEELSIDFGRLIAEGRKFAFEASPILRTLETMT